jgi:hypothetical protein
VEFVRQLRRPKEIKVQPNLAPLVGEVNRYLGRGLFCIYDSYFGAFVVNCDLPELLKLE